MIQTPNNKNILIDGGDNKYSVLLPYLLDKRIKSIDYMIVSHFDSDHSNGLLDVIEKIRVKNIIISKQSETSNEFIEFMNIVNRKNIKIEEVSQGDRIIFEENIYMDIISPNEKLEFEDLNNNSIVAKLIYNKFSILFTGDIGFKAEELLKQNNENILQSTMIKIAHHGSGSSSDLSFLEAVKPKFALIGVRKR